MAKSKLPKSVRKHIRQEKARIRREISDLEKQRQEIHKLYEKILSHSSQHKKSS